MRYSLRRLVGRLSARQRTAAVAELNHQFRFLYDSESSTPPRRHYKNVAHRLRAQKHCATGGNRPATALNPTDRSKTPYGAVRSPWQHAQFSAASSHVTFFGFCRQVNRLNIRTTHKQLSFKTTSIDVPECFTDIAIPANLLRATEADQMHRAVTPMEQLQYPLPSSPNSPPRNLPLTHSITSLICIYVSQ